MKRFGLYHPGDASAAVVPRVGFLDKPGCVILPSTARRPRHRRSATDGLSLFTSARRAPAAPKSPDSQPDETPKPQHLVSPETTAARYCGQVFEEHGTEKPALNTALRTPIFLRDFRFYTVRGVAGRPK